jgi:hypothetical protein
LPKGSSGTLVSSLVLRKKGSGIKVDFSLF